MSTKEGLSRSEKRILHWLARGGVLHVSQSKCWVTASVGVEFDVLAGDVLVMDNAGILEAQVGHYTLTPKGAEIAQTIDESEV